MVPLPLLPPLFGGKDDASSTHASSSPTASAHNCCQLLKAQASLDWPLPVGKAGGNDGKGNGGNDDDIAGGSGQELDHAPAP